MSLENHQLGSATYLYSEKDIQNIFRGIYGIGAKSENDGNDNVRIYNNPRFHEFSQKDFNKPNDFFRKKNHYILTLWEKVNGKDHTPETFGDNMRGQVSSILKLQQDSEPKTFVFTVAIGGNHWATYAFNTNGEIMVFNSLPGYKDWDKAAVDGIKKALAENNIIPKNSTIYLKPTENDEQLQQKDPYICGGLCVTIGTAIDPNKSFAEQEANLKNIMAREAQAGNGYQGIRQEHQAILNDKKVDNPQHIQLPGNYVGINNVPPPPPSPKASNASSQYAPLPLNSRMAGNQKAIFDEDHINSIKSFFKFDGKESYTFSNDEQSLVISKGKERQFIVTQNIITSKVPLDKQSCQAMLATALHLYGEPLVVLPANDAEKQLIMELTHGGHRPKIILTSTQKEFDDALKELEKKAKQQNEQKSEQQTPYQPIPSNPQINASTEQIQPSLTQTGNYGSVTKLILDNIESGLNGTPEEKKAMLLNILGNNYPQQFKIETTNDRHVTISAQNPQAQKMMAKIDDAIRSTTNISKHIDNKTAVDKYQIEQLNAAMAQQKQRGNS